MPWIKVFINTSHFIRNYALHSFIFADCPLLIAAECSVMAGFNCSSVLMLLNGASQGTIHQGTAVDKQKIFSPLHNTIG